MLEYGRSALVILAGYAAMVVLVVFTSILLAVIFPGPSAGEPTQAYVIGNLICGFLAAVAGGWITARIAASRPLLHAALLSALVIGIGLLMVTSETREPGQPAWYPAVIVILGAAGAFAGGFIRAARTEPIR